MAYTSSRFSLPSSIASPATSLYGSSQSNSTSTLNRRESVRSVIHPSSLQQQLFGAPSSSSAPPTNNILDRSIGRTASAKVSVGAWAFLFAEIVGYSQSRVDSVSDLEARLSSLGYDAGQRILALLLLRNTQASSTKDPKREHRLIPALQFIHTQIYRYCFGKPADGLERSVEEENEYMITLNQPPLTQFISIPKDMSQLSCEAFTAGIVEGVLDGLDMVSLLCTVTAHCQPARVTAHTVPTDAYPQRSVILIKLDQKVMDREAMLGK
ncbi:uncharacterized protein L203_100378 [Cryptococcus depauperatus CBS 7841]|uniref:Trafficking protein particle complex subunit n=1 Tax=Cryptococcus depauperatus CBS 7841 TaxID=1295531 RepID=A0AAJ8JMX5_9TREE